MKDLAEVREKEGRMKGLDTVTEQQLFNSGPKRLFIKIENEKVKLKITWRIKKVHRDQVKEEACYQAPVPLASPSSSWLFVCFFLFNSDRNH